MVNYYIYAKDFSGSTKGDQHYHSNGMKTLQQFKSEVWSINEELKTREPQAKSKIIYLHWGDSCYEVSEKECMDTYSQCVGKLMGTEPATIINWIKENYNICGESNKIRLLYIITDGLICEREDEVKCIELNKSIHYDRVVFHAFNEDLNKIDLSVAVSFLKSRCKIYRNYKLFDDTDISEDFKYDTINVGNFYSEKEKLKSYLKLKYISKSNHDAIVLREINQLKKLQDRLLAELAPFSQKTKVNLETKDKDEFLRQFVKTNWYQSLNVSAYNVKDEIEKSIQTLIDYITTEKKSRSFDALKFDMTCDKLIEGEPIVTTTFTTEQEIEFPDIILNDDKIIPVLILTEFSLLEKIIFHKTKKISDQVPLASFREFLSAMDCPLYLLDDPDISESIGHFYPLTFYKKLLKNTNKTEPRTRRPFYGGLVLLDTDEFDKYNDYVLSATYFNSKKVNYNVGLFYYVLWKNCENKERMDKNVVERFKKYVMRRISLTRCKVGLSSLPQHPPEITSLPTALWYSLELSSYLFKNDPKNFRHEQLRIYYGVVDSMIEILRYFDYSMDLASIEKRRDIISHAMVLKQIPNQAERAYYIVKTIFKNVDGFLISEIEHPSNLYKLKFLNLNYEKMLRDDLIKRKVHLNDYVHLMHFVDSVNNPNEIKICDETLRPHFLVDESKSFYTDLVQVTRKVVINNDDDMDKISITFDALDSLEFDKILSCYDLFIEYVQDIGDYPTFTEFIAYILNKKRFNGNLVTIFAANTYSEAEEMYSRYMNALANIDARQFIKVCMKYVNPVERYKVEKLRKFPSDKEINTFIDSEDLNVKLKKNAGFYCEIM